MLDYFTSSIITSVFWGFMSLASATMGKTDKDVGLFFKLIIYGISGMLFLFSQQKTLVSKIQKIWNTNRKIMIIFIATVFAGAYPANRCLYNAYSNCGENAHIVMTVTYVLPVVIAVLGARLLLKEHIKPAAILGIFFILLGVLLLKVYGHNDPKIFKK